jgi:hypothetical protein
MRLLNDILMNASDASANVNSLGIDSSFMVAVSASAVVTGTAAGTLKLQACNDKLTPTHWIDVPSASQAVAGAGNYLIPKLDVAYQWLRVIYVSTSGTGTITANLKSIGF